MSPRYINPVQWQQSIGYARQACARLFRDGSTPADALAAFGLPRADLTLDWSTAVERIAHALCAPPCARPPDTSPFRKAPDLLWPPTRNRGPLFLRAGGSDTRSEATGICHASGLPYTAFRACEASKVWEGRTSVAQPVIQADSDDIDVEITEGEIFDARRQLVAELAL